MTSAGSAAAQAPPDTTARGGSFFGDVWEGLTGPAQAAWVRPLASAIVPGTGQLLAHKERGALYLFTEAFLLTRYLALNAEGQRERDRYRELAFVVARGQFNPVAQDTVFEYYEQMGRYVESGPFDIDPGPALQPPTDERSYNGQIWALARRTFFPDPANPPPVDSPEYQHALAFYAGRAIGPNFQWSWRNAGLEQDLYRQTIRESDAAFRQATQGLGLLLANHVLSAVDAFISERLSAGKRKVSVSTAFRPEPGRWTWSFAFVADVRLWF